MGLFDEVKRLVRPYGEEDISEDDILQVPDAQDRGRGKSDVTIDFPGDIKKNKVVNIHATTQLSVVLVKPERFDNAVEIADHLREKRTVVLNLESTNKEIARRLIDFLSGVAYANDGKIKKVANATYIITPFNVEILGDLIDELENNGLYF